MFIMVVENHVCSVTHHHNVNAWYVLAPCDEWEVTSKNVNMTNVSDVFV